MTQASSLPGSGVHIVIQAPMSSPPGGRAHRTRSLGLIRRRAPDARRAWPDPASPTTATSPPRAMAVRASATAPVQRPDSGGSSSCSWTRPANTGTPRPVGRDAACGRW
ncbi:hypothetical protein [Streptomyces sp. 2231.1]|uniref:hypothetical protein n=1 Tax=Streptomyces sp. 2231.1 TaxID=1855347 RepID=UPI0015A063A9|nr:hypothetical protein [Streptomyces sp. 2231.1]